MSFYYALDVIERERRDIARRITIVRVEGVNVVIYLILDVGYCIIDYCVRIMLFVILTFYL